MPICMKLITTSAYEIYFAFDRFCTHLTANRVNKLVGLRRRTGGFENVGCPLYPYALWAEERRRMARHCL